MCECGCGELSPLGKIRVEGGWSFIEVYPGCNNGCGTSWGLGVTFIADGDVMLDRWLLEDTPTVEFDKFGQWGRMILDTAILEKRFREECGAMEADAGEYEHPADALHDFIERGGLRGVQAETLDANVPTTEPVEGNDV